MHSQKSNQKLADSRTNDKLKNQQMHLAQTQTNIIHTKASNQEHHTFIQKSKPKISRDMNQDLHRQEPN